MSTASDKTGKERLLYFGTKAANEGRRHAERVAQETIQLHRPCVRVTEPKTQWPSRTRSSGSNDDDSLDLLKKHKPTQTHQDQHVSSWCQCQWQEAPISP